MADIGLINDATLTAIADAIRSKNGTTTKYKPSEMPAAIQDIEGELETRQNLFRSDLGSGEAILDLYSENITETVEYSLAQLDSISSVDFPNLTSISNYMFNGSKNITIIKTPSATIVGTYAFTNCSSLTSVDLSNATQIGSNAFYGCTSLTKIRLPKASTIGSKAFYNCSQLKSLVLDSTTVVSITSTDVLTRSAIGKGAGYIYVPADLIDSYKSHTYWSTYSARFKDISTYSG